MDPALAQAIAGIAFAVVALGVLAVYQQARTKREEREKAEEVRASLSGSPDAPPGVTGFFVARFRGSKARFFRVYPDDGALLFLHAGPFLIGVDAETPRGTDPRHWAVRSARLTLAGLAVGAVAALVALVVIGRGVARNANANPEAGGSIMIGVLGLIALLTVGFVVALPAAVWRITKRVAVLDALPLSGLRTLAETDEGSFRATPENVSDVRFDRLEPGTASGPGEEVGATLSFRHAPTGKWTVETTTTHDTAEAIEAFRRLLGVEAVPVSGGLEARLAGKPAAAEELVSSGAKATVPGPEADELPAPKPTRGTWSVNGFGTMICEARGFVDWGSGEEDHDGVLAGCLLGFPVFPSRAVHTYDWHYVGPGAGWTHRQIPIRWSWGLYAAAWLHRTWIWVMVAGLGLVAMASLVPDLSAQRRIALGAGGVLLAVAGVMTRLRLGHADRRHRDIRRVLGRHLLGSSDPATWRADVLDQVRSPARLYGTSTHAEAVPALLGTGRYSRAMFAARLAVAMEDPRTGEQLTSTILHHPDVRGILERIRQDRGCRSEAAARDDAWETAELFEGPPVI